MKILELTNFSAGICGVWSRVKQESLLLAKRGHKVKIMSSNLIKGSKEIARQKDSFAGIDIFRFPANKLGGESFMNWFSNQVEIEALKFKPDIIIAHSYRHLHTTKALVLAKKINAKVFLVTHAPFNRSSTRSFISKFFVWFYDKFIASNTLNKFTKVIAITKWEIPYLLKLGCKRDKIIYIPNGIPQEFFNIKISKREETNKLLFLGRIAPIKDLEILIKAVNILIMKNKNIFLTIVGPGDKVYLEEIKDLVNKLSLNKNILFKKPVYNLKEKIKVIDSSRIFILPSKSEGMPQSLIEAMSRGKIAISSNNQGGEELIQDSNNGYLFEIENSQQLADKIELALDKNKQNETIKRKARESVKKFKWENLIEDLEKLMKS